jgi:hypothetical protein
MTDDAMIAFIRTYGILVEDGEDWPSGEQRDRDRQAR